MEFAYSTAAFGSGIGDNGKVVATRGSVFSTSFYSDPIVFEATGPTPSFRVNIRTPTGTTGIRQRVRITPTPILLTHIKIQIANCAAASGIEFTNDADRAYYNLYTTSAWTPGTGPIEFYGQVTYTDYPGGVPLCSIPTIDTFTSPLRAGTGDILTVSGTGFGGTRGNGQLQLKDANNGGNGYLTLDDLDYVSWTNTEIRVRVPSYVLQGTTAGKFGTPGSGTIRITNSQGSSVESTSSLDVEYALRQIPQINSNAIVQKDPYYIAKLNCTDGLVFRIESAVRNDAAAIRNIEAALAAWSVRSGVSLTLEKDAQGQVIGQGNIADASDGVNAIFYQVFSPNVLMGTYTSNTTRCTNKVAIKDADIGISVAPNTNNTPVAWDYDLTGDVQGADFYSTFVHELGHVLGLAHIVTSNVPTNSSQQHEIMYAYEPINHSAATRRSLTTGRGKSLAAALANITASRSASWCAPELATLLSTGSTSCRNTRPAAPSLTGYVVPGNTQLDLTWNAIYNATGYRIETSLQPSSGFTVLRELTSNFTTTRITGIDELTTYYVRIRATNSGGISSPSNTVDLTTDDFRGVSPFPVPTNFQASFIATANILTWDYGLNGYSFLILRSTQADFGNSLSITTSTDVRTFTDTNVIPGTVYFYKVYAVQNGSQSLASPPASVTVPGCVAMATAGSINGPQRFTKGHSFRYSIPAVAGATNYTWSLTSQIPGEEAWFIFPGSPESPTSIIVANEGQPIYETYLTVYIEDNCGNVVARSTEVYVPQFKEADQSIKELAVYPNPLRDYFQVTLPKSWGASQVRLVDLKSGSIVKQWQSTSTQFEAKIEDLHPGIYILELLNKDQIERRRVIIAN